MHESFQSAGRNRQYYWPCVNQHSNLWSSHWFFFLRWLVSFSAYSDWYSAEYLKRPSANSVSVQIALLFFSPQAFISVSLTLGLCWNLSVFLSALQFAHSFKVASWTVVPLTSFVSNLSGIALFHCLISSVSQTVVSWFFPVLLIVVSVRVDLVLVSPSRLKVEVKKCWSLVV